MSKVNYDKAWKLLHDVPCKKCGAKTKNLILELDSISVVCNSGKLDKHIETLVQ